MLETLARTLGLQPQTLLLAGVALGSLTCVLGLGLGLAGRDPAAARLAETRGARAASAGMEGLLRDPQHDPRGIARTFVPTDLSQRVRLARDLAQAGFAGPRAVLRFQAVRTLLGLVLPVLILAAVTLGRTGALPLPPGVAARLAGLDQMRLAQGLVVLAALGYFGPQSWLRSRVAERRQRIEEALPNALDLLQVAVEAGLGFDAAMTRVGNELAAVSPDLAWEFLSVQRQVQAGRPRATAMADMADRTGVDTVRSFANVVAQSMRFGTPMSEALTAYAAEMRTVRELKAQEMANKLPVKMSGVLASLMLPALVLMTIGPVVIRYVRLGL